MTSVEDCAINISILYNQMVHCIFILNIIYLPPLLTYNFTLLQSVMEIEMCVYVG